MRQIPINTPWTAASWPKDPFKGKAYRLKKSSFLRPSEYNETVNQFNVMILQQAPGIMQDFHAIGTCDDNEENPNVAELRPEYLQSLGCGDFFHHALN